MGICYTKKSIEQIIHSKYTLAKDSTQILDTKEYYHVYLWKYTADDLAQKQVRFYDTQNVFQTIRGNAKVGNVGNQKGGQDQKQQNNEDQQQYLTGQPIQWPIKGQADEGYIIMTIKNNQKQMQVLTSTQSDTNNSTNLGNNLQKNKGINQLRLMKVPIQLLQILYMIKLDSFRQYFYTKIQKQSMQSEFQAEIQIIVGDLLQRVDCLKLVTIAYQLEKYIKRGGQNVMKMFYNQFNQISYLDAENNFNKENQFHYNITPDTYNNKAETKQVLLENNNNKKRQLILQNQIPLERIFSNEIARIIKSQTYPNQLQKQKQINNLFYTFYQTIKHFNLFKQTLLNNFYILPNQFQFINSQKLVPIIANKQNKAKNYSKKNIKSQVTRQIIQQNKLAFNRDTQPINIFIKTNKQAMNNRVTSRLINNKQIEKFPNVQNENDNQFTNQQNEISIIQKPMNTNGDKNIKDFRRQKQRESKNKNNNVNKMDISSPFICEITEIDGLNGFIGDCGDIDQEQRDIKDKGNMMKQVGKQKKKTKVIQHQGNVCDQSLFLPKQLQQLQINKKIYQLNLNQALTVLQYQQQQQIQQQKQIQQQQIQQQPSLHKQSTNKISPVPLLITTYAGSSQFHQIQSRNISLIINLSPQQCYNYFINDINYDWYWMERLDKEIIGIKNQQDIKTIKLNDIQQQYRWKLNIQCIVKNIVHRIQTHIETAIKQQQNTLIINKQSHHHQYPKVLIFCSHQNLIYSGTIAVSYLMLSNSYRLSYQQALQVVKISTFGKFIMPKVYEQQLRSLQLRVNELSSTVNLNALNTKTSSSYRAYQVGLYNEKDHNTIVARYIGQLSSSNQLQILPNNFMKTYFLIPNNFTSIIMKSINILRQDASLMNSNNYNQKISNISKLIKNMGLTLRLFYGKQIDIQQKKIYFQFTKSLLLTQLIKYEYINFTKKIFNVHKYKAKIDLIIEALKQIITSQSIQKSFRKPQTFDQDPITLINDLNLLKQTPLLQKYLTQQPFNSKQTLTFKYPILRPIFEGKKKDSYYFMIKKFKEEDKKDKQMGCNVMFYKGDEWIGLEQDKQRYFEKIVQEYLKDVHQQRIWIEDEQSGGDQSLFDRQSILF